MTLVAPPGMVGGRMLPGFPTASSYPFVDVVRGSEPPTATPATPGILDQPILGTGITGQNILDLYGRFFGSPEPSAGGDCPGVFSVRDPITGNCVDLSALPPGGRPAVTGAVTTKPNGAARFGPAVNGLYGEGRAPRVEVMQVRRCPPGYALGNDGVCYRGLRRNSPRREWPMGPKPLLTPGERNAIQTAKRAAKRLKGAKSDIRKTARALEAAAGITSPRRGGSRGVITKSEAARALRK